MKYIKFFPKWKIVIFVLFIISAPGCLFSQDSYGLDTAIFSTIMCLLIAVCPMLPDIIYLKNSKEKLWKRWDFVEGRQAQVRKERAEYGELTPAYTDIELKYALFVGSTSGKYRTTLRCCSCPDFQKRKVPCKHMYYLAAKCGIESL